MRWLHLPARWLLAVAPTPTVLLSSLTPTMLLHVPPQEGMLFFPRDSRTERTHRHTHTAPYFVPYFFSLLFFPSLRLTPTLCDALFYFGSPQMSTKIDFPRPLSHRTPTIAAGVGEIKKRSSSHWNMNEKEKKRSRGKFDVLLGLSIVSLHEEEEEGRFGRPQEIVTRTCCQGMLSDRAVATN